MTEEQPERVVWTGKTKTKTVFGHKFKQGEPRTLEELHTGVEPITLEDLQAMDPGFEAA